MIKKHQRNIMGFIRKVYYTYFDVKLGDQDKSWAPHKVCYVCVENLRKWPEGEKESIQIWCPTDMEGAKKNNNDCYFCMLLGQQTGNTKFPCFMYEWDSRARSQHWK
jgi:hypothetical protein